MYQILHSAHHFEIAIDVEKTMVGPLGVETEEPTSATIQTRSTQQEKSIYVSYSTLVLIEFSKDIQR